jgi:hypothetical protein
MAHLLNSREGLRFGDLGVIVGLCVLYSSLGYFVVWPWLAGAGTIKVIVLHAVVISVGCLSALVTLSQLKKSFPSVRFQGRLFDFSRRSRKVLYGITMSLVVPLAVRVLYELRRH